VIAVLVVCSVFVLVHVVVGQRGLDNAWRLYDAVCKRIGIQPRSVPRSLWRYPASLFVALVGAPFTGAFLLWMPRRRRPWIALVALGIAKNAWQRGAICEHELVRFDEAVTSWTFRFGEELPEGRDPSNLEDDQ